MQHCQSGSVTLENELDEVNSKSSKSVSVGDHNFSESSLEREVQYLEQPASLEVEARADV